ncbi:uncharacterized protein IUM83_01742 [Phytophthora cinnamomi]|uniref:uncharacterized protein n=1 Tax=Phytophthora cinnamomi TaxID=4785 RepID=UPI00355AB4E5|nr:hypothetical protein IUM83_01742 [Phytophthora cinnamomi]
MGASQSLDALFGSPSCQTDSEQADVYQYLRRVEKTLWLAGPWWEHQRDVLEIEAADARARSPSKRSSTPRDPFKRMTPHEALVAIPAMLDEMWVSPLVALVDCVDPIAKSAGLALLSRIVQRDSVAKIFIAVKGMNKVMALLDSEDRQATYLGLEVIFALCSGSPSVILPLCEAGLIGRLTELAKGENLELVLASLKVLRLTLRQILMELVHSPHAAIAKTAITCIGLSLPNAENLAEILRLGCIDIFLRLMTPTNSNADAVIFALSLIADETDTIFPREQTTTTLGRMLETLRGAAKRSAAASATSFLFASLAKSSIFHIAICTETNLGILAKLLVGGSPEVLGSTAYALGIVALHANDRLGSHAGNKVKLGGKVCFEKLLSLVHHEALGVAKSAARALAVLVVGNDANKKFLLQCEAPVVAELSALLKGSNGTIVESAMLVLGELAPMPAQALELSRCVDVLSVVRLLTHINSRIARAALLVVRHLTRESFNKTRFGLRECVEALLARLRVGLGGTSGADELEMVELTITCLANLSFASSNASRIAEAKDERSGSLLLLLQLAASALPAPLQDYLSEKEVMRLMSTGKGLGLGYPPKAGSPGKSPLRGVSPVDTENNGPWIPRDQQEEDDEEMYESMARNSPKKSVEARGGSPRREKSDEPREAETDSPSQTLDFSAFPSLQTAVLEQTLLVLSNCADNYRSAKVVDILAVAVLCQALLHSSELVARCGCYTLACWLKQNNALQDAATRRGALQALSKLLTSTSLVVVEAAAYVLAKLAARGGNPMKLLSLDVPATLVHGILRKPANVPHDRVLDRAVRLLGTLTQFSRVRQSLKGEEIIADVLTPLLQLHPQTLGKNLSRLVLALLADDSLKFFLPKKTVSLLRACFVHEATNAKTIRNVLRIFALLVTVEEHKTTITLEDSGEALGRMVQELRIEEGVLGENDETVLGLLACIAGTRRIAVILHENDVYVRLPPYILVPEEPLPVDKENVDKTMELRRLHTVQIAARLCKALGDQATRRLSELEFTSLLVELLRVELPPAPLPEVEGEASAPPLAARPSALSLLAWECIDVLQQLCPSAYDEQVIAEEGGVEVLVAYFELWLAVASGTAPDLFPADGGDSLVLAFAVSLAAIVRTLSGQTPNRELLVQAGGFPLVLKALGLGTPELPEPQREQLAEALAGLSALPIMVPYLEASPDLVAPLFRFMVAPQTQRQSHLLLLALRAFADVMEVSPASRAYVLLITGGAIQPLPFLLTCLECSTVSASDDSILRLLHTMRSLQRLVTDETTARTIAPLAGVPAIGKLLSLTLPALPNYDDRLDIVQLMVTETLGYLAFFGHAPRLRLERSAVARLLAQADHANDERVKPEGVATSIWTLALLATPQASSEETEEEGIVLAFDVAQVVSKLFGIVEQMTTATIASLENDAAEAPELLHLPLSVLVKVSAIPAAHVRYLELLPRICRLLDGEHGPALLTALGRFVIELIRAFVGNGEFASPYAALFNSGEDIPALLQLVGSSSDEVAIPSAQLMLAVLKQREVRVALVVADGVPALVVALCQARNIKVQNLLLALILDLSRGDTEVQALLLVAPGCVARLVECIQEWVDARGTPDAKETWSNLNKRLALTCTLLTELSRALHGPERIVEVNGHLPLLALSIQQQQDDDIQGAQTTIQILTNLAIAGMTVAPGLAASKLPAHFLSCVLSYEKEEGRLSQKNALPLKRRLALSGLVALAKANRELRANLASSGPLVVLLERLLQKPEESAGTKRADTFSSVSRDALLLLYLMSTAGCIELVGHSSAEILTRVCGVINQHLALHLGREGDSVQDEEATPVEVTHGLKLLANLLDVAYQQENKVAWHPEELLELAPLLETRVATHQTPKRQLPALRVLRGAFSLTTVETPTESFYFPLFPKLLAELLTVLLVSASRQHHDIAERIIVSAFQNNPERARESVGDNQILEQLLIVFTQPGNDAAQRASELAVVLTQVLYVSIARGFVVSRRFLAKLSALLASYAHEALLADGDDVNQPLKRALSIYLSFVHSSCPPTSAMRSGISDMLRSEGDSRRALIVLIHQLLLVHSTVCLTTNPSVVTLNDEDIMLWTCIVETVSPLTPALAALFTAQAPTATWMCLLRDWFNWVETTERPDNELLRNSCRMLSVVAHLTTSEEETEESLSGARNDLCSRCLAVLSCGGDVLAPRVVEGALQALMDVREAWGDTFVLTGCSAFAGTTALLPKLLHIFHMPEREANRSRHLVLQLLLLLASTGYFIEEMKAAGARSAVENNPLISPDDKALPVALLGMLGYSADLNEEFARALEQFDAASSELERRERVAYLLRFLERYALTHAPTKEQAIDSFMTYLVADAEKAQAAAIAPEREPEVTKGEQASADQLALTITSDCLASLVKIAGWSPTPDLSLSTTLQSGFGELYLTRWNLNALLAVAFARQRGEEDNDFQERPRLAMSQIVQVLELAALVRAQLDEDAQSGETDVLVVGRIDARWLCNAFMLVTGHFTSPTANSQPGSDDLLLVEQVLALLHWLAVNSSTCFEDICRYAVLLRAFLAPLTPIFCGGANSESDIGHGAMELFLSLVEMVVNTPTPGAETTASIDEVLVDLLMFLYAQVDNGLLQGVRARLLLCVLVILQRTGDAGRAACVAYERAMQQIMWHIHASPATELQARCSWELLGSLSEMDPAITALFNLDAIPTLLRECGCDPNVQQSPPSWRDSKRAVAFRQAEALKCLSRAARTHDEVLLKIGEAPGIAAVLFGSLAAGPVGKGDSSSRRPSTKEGQPVDSAGTQAHAAHLIARIAAQEDLRASLVSPENISLLIESLESVHLPVVLHALQALAHLCAFSLCLDALVHNATVPVLAQILFSPLVATPRRREIEACVLALLGKMCDRSQIVSRRIVSSNLLPKLREFLVVEKQLEYTQQEPQPGEFGVHNNAVSIVYSLSKDAELLPKLVSNGILETLCDQVLDYSQGATQRKALGAVSRLASVADMDAPFLQLMISQVVESVRRSVPVPEAHRTVTNALAVFVAVIKGGKNRHNLIQQRQQRRPQSQQQQQRHYGNGEEEVNIRELLQKREGLRVALDLLGASELRVKLEAFRVVSEFVEDHPNFDEVRELLLGSEEQGGSHALLSLVRALSDEARSATAAMTSALPSARTRGKNELLLVVMIFLNMLITDETLKVKLAPTTYDVVLQVVVAMSPAPTSQQRVLAESLKALTTMTQAGQITDLCPEAALVSSVEPLVKVLRELSVTEGGAGSTAMRLNALFLLVNFASSAQCRGRMAHCGALEALLGIIQFPGGGGANQDEQLVQLSLLGVALMTTSGVSDAAAVVELSRSVDTLVRLLSSKSASIQANSVWVVSNISSEASLKDAIVARGGPTALQAVLNDSMSTEGAISAQLQRPSSSTMRIREYAPKAIKALGFAPIMPPAPST